MELEASELVPEPWDERLQGIQSTAGSSAGTETGQLAVLDGGGGGCDGHASQGEDDSRLHVETREVYLSKNESERPALQCRIMNE